MRCLYCGKELALLKRWTGGGEFCSDAHRQQYQQEYNQLALDRLLQAKPQQPNEPERKPAPAEKTVAPAIAEAKPVEEIQQFVAPPVTAAPEPAAAPFAPVARMEEPDEVMAPAGPVGFLVETPVAAMATVTSIGRSEMDLVRQALPALPRRGFDVLETHLVTAGQVVFEPYSRILDSAAKPDERRLEIRDFVRGNPTVEFDLNGMTEVGIDTFEEPMEILIFPHPPQGSPPLWQEPEKKFGEMESELGALARVLFRTTGILDNEDGLAALPVDQVHAAPAPPPVVEIPTPKPQAPVVPQPAATRVPPPTVEIPAPKPPAPVEVKTAPVAPPPAAQPAPVVPQPAVARIPPPPIEIPAPKPPAQPVEVKTVPPVAPKPEPPVEVKTAPVVTSKPLFVWPVPVAKPVETPVAKAPEKKPDPVPDLVTKPLPLTLHGLSAAKGKPVQVFPAASAGVEVQAPRSAALPLRPVMVFGPAPAAAQPPAQAPEKPADKRPDRTVVIKTDAKSDPKKQQPEKPAPPKNRRPEVRVVEPEKREPEKKDPERKIAAAAAATVEPKPAAVPARAPEEPFGLSLSLPASSGFWSKLPAAGKIGLAAAVVLAIAGVIGFAMKGSGTAASSGPRIVGAGPSIAGADSGWITDWGAEAGVRRQRQISVLRPSLNLTDYRMQFQGQIDSKAMGWVFRAMDPKNYYVTKLEIVKPGANPAVALVRFAVINGEEEPRSQFPLTMPVRLDTMYKVRFDVVGDHFTTWIQDQKVDDWTDKRLKTGGVGLYSERNERSTLKGGVSIVPLIIKP